MNLITKIYTAVPPEARVIREEVFLVEQGFEIEFDEIDAVATHLVLFEGETPVATCRVFPSEADGIYIIGRIAVVKEHRGRHLGSAIVKAAEDHVRSIGGREMRLHAQCQAVPFYEKIGYGSFGGIEYEEFCPHIWMKKEL